MAILRRTDILGGLMCAAIGVIALVLMANLRMGTADAMGPGFAPVWLARLLIAFGGIIFVKGLFNGEAIAPSLAMLRPLLAILGAIVFFAAALPRMGFAPTAFLLLLGAAAAGRDFRFREALIVAVIGAAATTALFIWGLKLNIAVWPA